MGGRDGEREHNHVMKISFITCKHNTAYHCAGKGSISQRVLELQTSATARL